MKNLNNVIPFKSLNNNLIISDSDIASIISGLINIVKNNNINKIKAEYEVIIKKKNEEILELKTKLKMAEFKIK